MEELSELVSVCRALDTDKVTERKRQIDKLQLLLTKSYIVRALDQNGDKKAKNPNHHKLFSWDTLFKVVKAQVRKEAELLRKGKESQSSITLNNREKKRREIFDLLKHVIKLTDKRGERLKVTDVTSEIEEVLQDDYLFKTYGVDYSVILLKDILSKRVYWKDIPNARWHFFLGFYLDILKEDSFPDRVLLTRLIHAIVFGASLNCDLRPKKILPAFKEYIANIRNERSQAPMENMMAASNILCRHWAPNARLQICGFGETVIISMLHVWQKHPSEHVKDQLIEFFSLQMSAHHPGGVKSESVGAFAIDWDLWKGHMRKIYDAMYKSLVDIEDRSRFQKSTREAIVLKSNMVDLIADICNQLFTEGVNIMEITQLNVDAQPGAAPKRRKVETGWDVIRDKISSLGTSVQLVPWLQILNRLLAKHPSSLPDDVVTPLLNTLYQSQNDCRRADVLSWLHQCVIALAECPNANLVIDLEVQWQKVWSNTIRCVSAHPGVASGWRLLCVLMKRKLVTNHREVWSLFMPQVTPCSQPAVVLLATALASLDLPDKISSGFLFGPQMFGIETNHPHQYRSILLNWLMPSSESDSEQPLSKRLVDNPSPSLLANVIVMLMLRNTHDVSVPQESSEPEENQQLELLYLEASFNSTLEQFEKHQKLKPVCNSSPSSLPIIQRQIFELLQRDAELFLQHTPGDIDIGQLEHAVYLTAIMIQTLQMLVIKNVIKLDQVKQLPVWETAVNLVKFVTASFSQTIKKDGVLNLGKILELFGEFSQVDESDALENNQQRAAVFRAVVPPALLEKISSLITHSPASVSRSSSTQGLASQRDSQAKPSKSKDFDINMDLDEVSVVDDLDMDENFNLSHDLDSQESGSEGGGETSLFSSTLLKDYQRLGLQAAAVACSMCNYESRFLVPGTQTDASTSRSKLLALLENLNSNNPWNPKDPYHLQLMKVIFKNVTLPGHKLVDDDLDLLLESLRNVCKHFRRDQDICMEMLELTGLLLESLSRGERPSADRVAVRRDALHLLGVFWKLRVKQYTYITRLAVAKCMRAVIMCDRERRWSYWEPKGEDGDNDTKTYLADECLQLLMDNHHSIRQIAVQSLRSLFSTHGDLGSVDFKTKQEDVFEDIYELLLQLLNVEGEFSSDELRDMSANRTASLLHALSAIARISPVCEKKAVFAIFQVAKENKMDYHLISKVLQQVSKTQQSDSLEQYMRSHLPYVVHHWFDNDYSVQQLPFQFFGFRTQKEFLVEHVNTLLPFMIKKRDTEGVKWIASQLSQDWLFLVKTSLPGVLIHILPWFAASKNGNLSPANQAKAGEATSCYDMLIKHISHEDIEVAIAKNLPEIVVDLLMTLYDKPARAADRTERGIGAPEPNLPHFPRKLIIMTLDYLRKGHGGDIKSIVSLLCRAQDGVQQVLKSLHWHLLSERTTHEVYRVLQMYSLYVGLLLKEVDGDLGESWPFVVREVVYTMGHVLRSLGDKIGSHNYYERQSISEVICILQSLCEVACNTTNQKLSANETLGQFLPIIVTSVVPFVKEEGKQGEECVEFLEYLVLQCTDTLRDSLKLLDPLPELPKLIRVTVKLDNLKYADGEFTLLQEIEHFVNVGQRYTSGKNINRLRGLQFLRGQLNSRKKELAMLMKMHVVEQEEDSLVTKLLSELMHFAKSENADVAKEAASCLGEIGPFDLAAMTLKVSSPRDKVVATVYSKTNLCKMYCGILYALDGYLLHENVDVVEAASVVLKRILQTKTGYEFAVLHESKVPGDLTLQFLFPFRTSKKKVFDPSNSEDGDGKFLQLVDKVELWQPAHSNHGIWVRDLAIALLESGAVKDHVLYLIGPVCQVKMEFCEMVLPYLVHDVLANGNSNHEQVLSNQIGLWLESHCERKHSSSRSNTPFSRSSSVNSQSIVSNLASVKTLISVVQYLRQQSRSSGSGRGSKATAWDNNFWLEINYLNVAEAALNCNLHFSAIMYAELWCYIMRGKKSDRPRGSQVEEQFSQNDQWSMLGSMSKEDALRAQDLMLQAYRSIGAPDAIYGCHTAKTSDSQARIKMYEHEEQWDKALSSYDLQTSHEPTAGNLSGLLQALQNSGLHQVLDNYLQGTTLANNEMQTELQNFQYQAAWKNSKWDLQVTSRFDSNCGFQQSLYNSLWAIREQDASILLPALDQARKCAVMEIHQGHQESVRSFYPYLSKLLCLSQVTDLASIDVADIEAVEEVQKKWMEQNALLDNDYLFIEPVLAVRGALMKMAYDLSDKSTPTMKIYMSTLEDIVRRAREAGRPQIGEKAIYQLQVCKQNSPDPFWSWQIEEAKFFWARQEFDVAKNLLKELIDKLEMIQDENYEAAYLYPRCLGLYGDWLASTHSASPDEILDDYLIKAVEQLESEDDAALDAFLSLARFADAQYQHIEDYMKSPTYDAKRVLAQQAKEDAQNLRKLGEQRSRYLMTLEKQSLIDQQELTRMTADKERFLKHAIQNYVKCLQLGTKHDLRVFRLTSLWFANLSNDRVNTCIRDGLQRISTHKFLPLMYQLAARMSSAMGGNVEFQSTLDKLIEAVVVDHPYHSLNIVLALAHAKKDEDPNITSASTSSGRKTGRLSKSSSLQKQEDRVIAAQELVQKLKGGKRAAIVKDTEKLCLAYIQLAYHNVDQHKKETKPIPFPSSVVLPKFSKLKNIAVPTMELPVDLSCKYEHITYIDKFANTFKLAGGINLPKIISCIGSDGVSRRQLVKGQDDLRQDAVMQQVFSLVNNLLNKEAGTRKRKLKVRTYKVIPLSQRSGLLQWCEGTIPLGDYLAGPKDDPKKGAHARYRPNDYSIHDCWNKLSKAHKESRATQPSVFLDVCRKLQPVFRHFFLENYTEPADWYEHSLNYRRSVATTSIVGYILGLGDRHVANILIDTRTAELIHIDLGVAFEQGRIMPTPETVPFRLTRDLVDGLGVSGVEGDFRRCCEETMKVMHQSHEALLTILQVLLYDPLYSWTLSPQKAMALQQKRAAKVESDVNNLTVDFTEMSSASGVQRESEPVNQVAERVLLRLRQKLQGIENGVQLSVSGQVNHLIQQARDPNNLGRLFPGWQPYL